MSLKKTALSLVAMVALVLGGSLFMSSEASAATYSNYSIVDYLILHDKNSSFDHREDLAKHYGIEGYRGTAVQNLTLLSILREGNREIEVNSVVDNHRSTHKESSNNVEGRTLTVRATAYTAHCAGCSGITATGINLLTHPNKKVIAVDPDVIPLGSKVYVEGYGYAVAGDTGGAIDGNRIDVFIPSLSEALKFGVRTVEVTVLE